MELKTHIRHYFDPRNGKLYFSVVDVIAELTESKDSQNYWKVLKNRLNKKNPQLVTRCNQLKMKARDRKFYLTDVADRDTMERILGSVPKANIVAFESLIKQIIKAKADKTPLLIDGALRVPTISTFSIKPKCLCSLEKISFKH